MFKLNSLKSFFLPALYFGPEVAVLAPEATAATTAELTAEEIAAQQLAAEQAAQAAKAAEAVREAQAAQQATNEAIRQTVTQTPVSTPGAGGISDLVNTTGGPSTWEQIFNQGKNIADASTKLGDLAGRGNGALSELLNKTVSLGPEYDGMVKGPVSLGPGYDGVVTGPVSLPPVQPSYPIPDLGQLVNPYPASAIEPVVPPAPLAPAVPSMPPPEYGFTGDVESSIPTTASAVPPATPLEQISTGPTSGIKALANEVFANQTMVTSSAVTPPAPITSAPTLSFPPGGSSAGIDQLTQNQILNALKGEGVPPSGPPSGLFANQTMVTPSAVTPSAPIPSATLQSLPQAPAGIDQLTQNRMLSALKGEGATPGIYQEAVAKTPFSTVGNAPTQFAGNTSNFGANPVERYTPYDQSFGVNNRIPTETGGLPGAMTGVSTPLPAQVGNAAGESDLMSGIKGLWNEFKGMPLKDKMLTGLMASSAYQMLNQPKPYEKPKYKSTWNGSSYTGYQPVQPAPYRPAYADGGMLAVGGNPGMSMQGANDPLAFQSTGVERMASGGLSDLGSYSDGGRMLKGPGDGMSDDIPATIANKQPARLANEEFVIPADVVSHLGNGSSESGAKQLYRMMDRIRQARTGTKKQGKQINPEKYMPV